MPKRRAKMNKAVHKQVSNAAHNQLPTWAQKPAGVKGSAAVRVKPQAQPQPKTPPKDTDGYKGVPTYRQPSGGISGSPQMVLVLLLTLLIIAEWKPLFSGFVNLAWNKSNQSGTSIKTLPWGGTIGMVVFILIAVGISAASDTLAGLMIVISLGLITVYLIENKGGGFTALFNAINPVSQSNVPQSPPSTTTSATGPGGGTKNK